MIGETLQFPPLEISTKLAIAMGIGMLVGLEREWSQKDLGTRTFTIVALAGALSVLVDPLTSSLSFAGVLLILLLSGLRSLRDSKPIETTTAAAVILTFILGALVGKGHQYTPVAAAILTTMLLSMKPALTHFAGGLLVKEVRAAVLLGLIAFVIYPVLPNRTVDPFNLINPREAWLTVVVIAALGFVNYVLLKMYSSRGLYYSAVLGGLVNSTAAIAELAGSLRDKREHLVALAATIDLLTVIPMFMRNLFILALFAPRASVTAAGPLVAMTATAALCIWFERRSPRGEVANIQLSSPLSLPKVLKFGLIFLLIEILGTVAERYLGSRGFLVVSIVGGLVSSASTAGAAATLAMHHEIDLQTAGMATVFTSMTSALSNLPLFHQQIRHWPATRKVALLSLAIVGVGLLTTLLVHLFAPL